MQSSGPYADDQEVKRVFQKLKADIHLAEKLPTRIQRHHEVEKAITSFRNTPCGRLMSRLLNEEGMVLIPPACGVDTKEMLARVQDKLLSTNDSSERVVSDKVMKNEPRIKGESRFMIDPEKVGPDFVRHANEMADTLECVLLAIAYGPYEHAVAENISVLLNDGRVGVQLLHRDQNPHDIEKLMKCGSGGGSRGRPQPPPYSALCAFQDGTVLHAIKGSHLRPLETKFDSSQAKECHIPTGWSCVFHAALVHAGMASVGSYHARLHMYLKAVGCSQAYAGKIQVVD